MFEFCQIFSHFGVPLFWWYITSTSYLLMCQGSGIHYDIEMKSMCMKQGFFSSVNVNWLKLIELLYQFM